MIRDIQTYGRFKFGVVNDEKVKEDTFRMRYEVYVQEFGFEKKEDHPGGLETDDWENESIHLACLNENDSVVGTIRLVLNSEKGFPIEKTGDLSFIGEKPDNDKIAEISRLTVSKDLRRRKEDGIHGVESYLKKKEGGVLPDDGTIPPEMRGRKNPVLLLGLCQAMYQESKRIGLSHWYIITEDKLFYALKKFNFLFHPIGEKLWYHGWRRPYLGIISEIEKLLMEKSPDMLKFLLTGLDKKYHPDGFDIEKYNSL
ncbi:MAG: long-chain N-acyl amino acid synthase [Deltaproteobacteria bacterium]|nr:MAG: long-chain N-acyl amino acid synthase [Deltaproteobacteria bacterium]